MSDAQKLKDALDEYVKANKTLDDKLNKVQEANRQARQEQKERSNR